VQNERPAATFVGKAGIADAPQYAPQLQLLIAVRSSNIVKNKLALSAEAFLSASAFALAASSRSVAFGTGSGMPAPCATCFCRHAEFAPVSIEGPVATKSPGKHVKALCVTICFPRVHADAVGSCLYATETQAEAAISCITACGTA
jgi:hypothetical protein